MSKNCVKLFNWELEVPNLKEYHTLKREIFSQHQYFLELDNPRPVVIDAGAHIGLSTFYFKRLFPNSSIIALEPHSQAFKFLQQNLTFNHLAQVLTLNLALWPVNQNLELYADSSPESWWSNTSVIAKPQYLAFSAPTVTLNELHDGVGETIDVLKLDVEGAEWDILFHEFAHFNYIDHYLVEYHPQLGRTLLDFCTNFPNSHTVTCFKNGRYVNPKSRHPGLVIVHADRL